MASLVRLLSRIFKRNASTSIVMPKDTISRIGEDCLVVIFKYLDTVQLYRALAVCKAFRDLINAHCQEGLNANSFTISSLQLDKCSTHAKLLQLLQPIPPKFKELIILGEAEEEEEDTSYWNRKIPKFECKDNLELVSPFLSSSVTLVIRNFQLKWEEFQQNLKPQVKHVRFEQCSPPHNSYVMMSRGDYTSVMKKCSSGLIETGLSDSITHVFLKSTSIDSFSFPDKIQSLIISKCGFRHGSGGIAYWDMSHCKQLKHVEFISLEMYGVYGNPSFKLSPDISFLKMSKMLILGTCFQAIVNTSKTLRVLDLSCSLLEKKYNTLLDSTTWPVLEELYLCDFGLGKIPNFASNFPAIKKLDLGRNKFDVEEDAQVKEDVTKLLADEPRGLLTRWKLEKESFQKITYACSTMGGKYQHYGLHFTTTAKERGYEVVVSLHENHKNIFSNIHHA